MFKKVSCCLLTKLLSTVDSKVFTEEKKPLYTERVKMLSTQDSIYDFL